MRVLVYVVGQHEGNVVMRSLAEQDEAQLGGALSVLVRQKRDHVALDALLHRLHRSTGSEQDEVLMRICRLAFPHAFAEEAVLWPVIRRVLPDGEALTLQIEQEHQEVNELVSRLEAAAGDGSERQALLDRLTTVLREDVRDEEDVLLPRLQDQLSTARLRLLGIAWEVVRRITPTRPHPTVSRRPPGNVLAAAPLSVLDRARDLFDQAARRAPSEAAPALRATSQTLASVAGRVERLTPMRRGEQASTAISH